MNYTCEVTINLPRSQVIALFEDHDNYASWQPGLQAMTPLSGTPGQPNATTKLVYKDGGRTMEMVETIVKREPPETYSMTYDASGVHNVVINRFQEISPQQTRWVMDNEFRFSGFMKVMGFFLRGAFPKQTRETMEHFKKFAESSAK